MAKSKKKKGDFKRDESFRDVVKELQSVLGEQTPKRTHEPEPAKKGIPWAQVKKRLKKSKKDSKEQAIAEQYFNNLIAHQTDIEGSSRPMSAAAAAIQEYQGNIRSNCNDKLSRAMNPLAVTSCQAIIESGAKKISADTKLPLGHEVRSNVEDLKVITPIKELYSSEAVFNYNCRVIRELAKHTARQPETTPEQRDALKKVYDSYTEALKQSDALLNSLQPSIDAINNGESSTQVLQSFLDNVDPTTFADYSIACTGIASLKEELKQGQLAQFDFATDNYPVVMSDGVTVVDKPGVPQAILDKASDTMSKSLPSTPQPSKDASKHIDTGGFVIMGVQRVTRFGILVDPVRKATLDSNKESVLDSESSARLDAIQETANISPKVIEVQQEVVLAETKDYQKAAKAEVEEKARAEVEETSSHTM